MDAGCSSRVVFSAFSWLGKSPFELGLRKRNKCQVNHTERSLVLSVNLSSSLVIIYKNINRFMLHSQTCMHNTHGSVVITEKSVAARIGVFKA